MTNQKQKSPKSKPKQVGKDAEKKQAEHQTDGTSEQSREERARRRFGNGKRDEVDEASWESFPASDPPSTNAGNI